MAMAFLRIVRVSAWLALVVAAAIGALLLATPGGMRGPWQPLDPAAPPGAATAARLAGLGDDHTACRVLLDRAGVTYATLPRVVRGENCGYADGLRWGAGGARELGYAPARPALACSLAAALALWEWNVVQPAAARHLGATVTRIDHFGTYSCRRLYGRASGGWSEHAHARAIDVAGFRLADGRRITVAADWTGRDAEAAFLHAVRDGACGLFATTLSPDYNAAHRDHFHLDEAVRPGGWRACR